MIKPAKPSRLLSNELKRSHRDFLREQAKKRLRVSPKFMKLLEQIRKRK